MKKLLALFLALVCVLSCASFATAEEPSYDGGMTYATGFPITKEPITLKAYVLDAGALRPEMGNTKVIQYIADKTNITLDITVLTDAEQTSLMFVDGDYPDFVMAVSASSQQILDAAEAGDIVELTPYIDEVCPAWKKFFNDYPLAYNSCLNANKQLYNLTFCNFAPFDRDLRDMFMINTKWCQELGLETPATIAQFTDYLRAVRDHAGEGTIPANVEPLHFYKDGGVGGYIDFFNFFGVTVSQPNFLTVFDGQVKYMAMEEDCKEVLKWLQSLYREGLIKPESFTDDWNMHCSKLFSKEGTTLGAYFAYNNENVAYFAPVSPLNAENGRKPTIRRQAYTGTGNKFMMFSNNQYPYATMRLMEAIVDYADPAFCETVNMGMEGIVWNYNEDGKIVEGYLKEDGAYQRYQDDHADWATNYGFWNSFIGIRTPEWYSDYYFEMQNIVPNTRAWAFEQFYKEWVNEESTTYVSGALSAEDTERAKELQADIKSLRQTTFANWIGGKGDIDAEWDGYIQKMKSLRVEEWLKLKQAAYEKVYAPAK